jgi:hypothetical protein
LVSDCSAIEKTVPVLSQAECPQMLLVHIVIVLYGLVCGSLFLFANHQDHFASNNDAINETTPQEKSPEVCIETIVHDIEIHFRCHVCYLQTCKGGWGIYPPSFFLSLLDTGPGIATDCFIA